MTRRVFAMLVLTRKVSESIVIDTSDGLIEIMFVGFRDGQRVRIGVEAPEGVLVNRREIWEEINRNGKGKGKRHGC